MSWINILWPMIAAASLTLALMHALIWSRQRRAWAHLLFALTAAMMAAIAGSELLLMRAGTTAEFGLVLRWSHVPLWMFFISLVGFVRLYFRGGRPWLAWSVCGLRTLALILNFSFSPNLNYKAVTALRHIRFLGDSVTVAEGVPNPWTLVGRLSSLLLLLFIADATVIAWRRGERRRALVVGGSMIACSAAAFIQTSLVLLGLVQAPFFVSIFYIGIVLAMSWELTCDVLRAAHLARELEESEARFRNMANSAPVMIWMAGTDMLCTFFNKFWLDFTGRTVAQELGNGWAEGVHREDYERCLGTYTNAFNARVTFTMEYRLRRCDGEHRRVLDTGVPQFASDGTFLGYIGSAIDITAIRQVEEQFRLVIEGAPNAMIMTDAEGRMILVNAQAELVFGYSRQELVGCSVEMLVPERLRLAHAGHRGTYFAHPTARKMEAVADLFGRRKDGTEVLLEISLNPMPTPQGLFVLASITDVTRLRRMETEVQQFRNEAAHFSRVTTLGELSGVLAHELNQPLGAILANAEAAEIHLQNETPDLNEVRCILADIRKDDLRAGEIIHGMRAFLTRQELEMRPLAVNHLAEEAVMTLGGNPDFCKIALSVRIELGLPPVNGDRVHLQQVFVNLLSNGMDAMSVSPPAERRLTITARSADENTVEIAISDTGAGIPPEKLPHVFDPFHTSKRSGLGLGLAICRSIIEAHGGRISVENNAGRGATARFTLWKVEPAGPLPVSGGP